MGTWAASFAQPPHLCPPTSHQGSLVPQTPALNHLTFFLTARSTQWYHFFSPLSVVTQLSMYLTWTTSLQKGGEKASRSLVSMTTQSLDSPPNSAVSHCLCLSQIPHHPPTNPRGIPQGSALISLCGNPSHTTARLTSLGRASIRRLPSPSSS